MTPWTWVVIHHLQIINIELDTALKSVNRRGDRSTHIQRTGSPYNVGYQGGKSCWTRYGIELEIPYPIISGNLNNIPLSKWLILEIYAMQIAIPLLFFPSKFTGSSHFYFCHSWNHCVSINPATLTWCCGFLGSVMITALENEKSRVCRLVSLLVIVQSLLFWDHRSDFVNLGMSHLARYSLEGHNRHVVSCRLDRPSPSKFPVVAQTCLLGTTWISNPLVESWKTPSCSTDHELPVSPNLKRNCSPRARVHSRSEAVESCKASKRQYVLSKSANLEADWSSPYPFGGLQ